MTGLKGGQRMAAAQTRPLSKAVDRSIAAPDHFSDEEIGAMEAALQATIAPHEMAFYLRWMAQGMNANETASLMASARANMPAEGFAQIADTLQAAMPASRWTQAARALGLPPVPGLMTT